MNQLYEMDLILILSKEVKVPLEKVTKDKDGFFLTLDDKDHSEYFISRQDVSAPNSGGNTTNVFLGLVALYSAMQVDVQFKIIFPYDPDCVKTLLKI